MEFAPFVALRSPLRVLGLAGAELPEVLGRFGCRVGEELHFDAAEGFACEGEIQLGVVDILNAIGKRA